MYKLFLIPLLSLSLYGDMVKNKTLACPSIEILKKSVTIDLKEPMKLEIFTISNECVVLSKGDKIEVVSYDPRNSKENFLEIIYKKTDRTLFVRREAIFVEQGGKHNIYRF